MKYNITLQRAQMSNFVSKISLSGSRAHLYLRTGFHLSVLYLHISSTGIHNPATPLLYITEGPSPTLEFTNFPRH